MKPSHNSSCSRLGEDTDVGTSRDTGTAEGQEQSCAGYADRFITGSVQTDTGSVPAVSTGLHWSDYVGTVMVRCGIRRHSYRVEPGLYAVGRPDSDSHVLVTANYKLTFDALRRELNGRSLWILVLDTDGVNVWCAAGKGTFGTDELVQRIELCSLDTVVNHNRLILPQLAAPGVAGHEVKKRSGFRVIYGPVKARDLPSFLDAELKATPEMRRKAFPLAERIVLIPVELVPALKASAIILPVFIFLGGFMGSGSYWTQLVEHGIYSATAFSLALTAGAVLTPALLPWLPGRAFWIKGLILGIIASLFLVWLKAPRSGNPAAYAELIGWGLMVPAISAYLGMNFTGASTYTSLSGVRKEMKTAVPVQIVLGAFGLISWLVALVAS